jgi:predicted dehydrogenase
VGALQIAVVGFGRWGQFVVRDLQTIGVDVHVVTRRQDSAQRAAAAGANSVGTDLAAVRPVDGWVVVTPASKHAEVIDALLHRQEPIFVEKPLTTSVDDARRIPASSPIFVMDKWRYHSGLIEMSAQLPRLGRVQEFFIDYILESHAQSDVDALWDLAPHCIAIAAVLGEGTRAIRATSLNAYRASGSVDTEWLFDTAIAPAHVRISTEGSAKLQRIAVTGDRGVLELPDPYSPHLIIRDTEGACAGTVPVGQDLPLLRELQEFVEYLRGGATPRADLKTGIQAVELIAEMVKTASAPRDAAGLQPV